MIRKAFHLTHFVEKRKMLFQTSMTFFLPKIQMNVHADIFHTLKATPSQKAPKTDYSSNLYDSCTYAYTIACHRMERMERHSAIITSFCVPLEKESHIAFKRHVGEYMMTTFFLNYSFKGVECSLKYCALEGISNVIFFKVRGSL